MSDVNKKMMKGLKEVIMAFAMAFAGVAAVALGIGLIMAIFNGFAFFVK